MSIFLRMYRTLLGRGETDTSTVAPYSAPRRLSEPMDRTARPESTASKVFIAKAVISLAPDFTLTRSLTLMPSFS